MRRVGSALCAVAVGTHAVTLRRAVHTLDLPTRQVGDVRSSHGVLRRGETGPALLEETIGANLERTVATHPDREALVEVATGRRWTWAELDPDVDALASGLIAAGLEKGDRIGIWAPNCAEWTSRSTPRPRWALLVNVNPAYRTHELAYAVNQSGMRMLVAATGFKTSDYAAMVEEVRDECRALERVVTSTPRTGPSSSSARPATRCRRRARRADGGR